LAVFALSYDYKVVLHRLQDIIKFVNSTVIL